MTTLMSLVHLPTGQQQERGLLHTPREIAQQPETWKGTLAVFERERTRICRFLEPLGVPGPIEQRPTVMLIGAGTSDYIGSALALLLRQQWGCEVTACASTDVLPNLDEYVVRGRKYLWISFSRSGDSPEGVAVLEQAIDRFPEIAHLVVTCNAQGRMVPLCEAHTLGCVVILNDVVNDRGLAMTSSFTNMVVMGHCLRMPGLSSAMHQCSASSVLRVRRFLARGILSRVRSRPSGTPAFVWWPPGPWRRWRPNRL